MGSKRDAPGNVLYQAPGGKQVSISAETYSKVAGLGNQVATADISTLDRKELTGTLNDALANNTNSSGEWDSAENVVNPVAGELQDAIAGTKPKYRFRKYLDQVTQLQNDQPGQLQTVLSKGNFGGSALGGGAL